MTDSVRAFGKQVIKLVGGDACHMFEFIRVVVLAYLNIVGISFAFSSLARRLDSAGGIALAIIMSALNSVRCEVTWCFRLVFGQDVVIDGRNLFLQQLIGSGDYRDIIVHVA